MKKTIFALLCLALLSPAAFAVELPLRYEVSYQPAEPAQGGQAQFTLGAVVGAKTSVVSMTEQLVVSEIDNKLGTVSATFAVRQSGNTLDLTPESVQPNGKVITVVNYTVWDKGLAVAKGHHQVLLTKGERTVLPAVAGEEVSVCLVD